MFIQSFKAQGLSQLSYLVGNNGKAMVIDPRRDCESYAEAAATEGERANQASPHSRGADTVRLQGAPRGHRCAGCARN